jgi:DNA (cytosine-5)-methyltransferase 1
VTLTLIDFFCGAGGSSQGAHAVPGVDVRLAANHWNRAIESHALNFPDTEHFQGDIHDADVRRFPAGELFWASPECPTWSQARGKQRDYDKQPDLFGETLPDPATDRSRALMWDVPKYLEAMQLRGQPVLAGVVENVTDVRAWIHWREWVRSIENLGYRTRLIALNSMHARAHRTPYAPQSRDRLYLAYWSTGLRRDPDWDRWLRPQAWCPSCEQVVAAVQWWKKPGNDMGRYRQQYVYRCPKVACRGQLVEPAVMPAAAAIDWSIAGTRIGDRAVPLKPKTIARIEAGLRRYAHPVTLQTGGSDRQAGSRTRPVSEPLATQTATATPAVACPPMMVPAGGTWRDEATAVTEPMGARTTRESDGIAIPPFLVPLRSGRDRSLRADSDPLATVVADGGNHGLVTGDVPPFLTVHRGGDGDVRTGEITGPTPAVTASGNHLGLAVPPFIAELRNKQDARPISDPLSTVMTMGAHHGLVVPDGALVMRNNTARGDAGQMSTPVSEPVRTLTSAGHQSLIDWRHLLVPYYGTGVARPVSEPAGTVSTTDRYALASLAVAVEDVLFRMLEPAEIGAAMAFISGYQVLGNKRERVRQYGNAVTPPVTEVIISALVEAIRGEDLERAA